MMLQLLIAITVLLPAVVLAVTPVAPIFINGPAEVTLSWDGQVMAVEAEWTPTDPPNATSKSGVWVTKRNTAIRNSGYQPWTKIKTDQSGDGAVAEFGTSIQLTSDGKALLATVEDKMLPVAQSQKFSVGFMFTDSSKTSAKVPINSAAEPPNFIQYPKPFDINVTIPHALMKYAKQYPTLQIDTTRGIMSYDGQVVAFTTELKVTDSTYGGGNSAGNSLPTIAGHVYVFQGKPGKDYKATQVIQEPKIPNGPPTFVRQLSSDPIPAGYRKATCAEVISSTRNKKFVLAQVGAGETCSLVGGRVSLRAGTVCQPAPAATGCVIVASDLQKLNFGKNAAISGDGNWIAVSEDYIGGVFVFGRPSVADQFSTLPSAEITGLYPGNDAVAEMEEIALSTDGKYLVAGWKEPSSSTDPTRNETGSFSIFERNTACKTPQCRVRYTKICTVLTKVVGLDGIRMASMGVDSTSLRIVLGLAGQEAQIWDVNVAARRCPKVPTYTFDAKPFSNSTDPSNIQTVFEGVDISGDGMTVALGAEAQNAVALVFPPAIAQ